VRSVAHKYFASIFKVDQPRRVGEPNQEQREREKAPEFLSKGFFMWYLARQQVHSLTLGSRSGGLDGVDKTVSLKEVSSADAAVGETAVSAAAEEEEEAEEEEVVVVVEEVAMQEEEEQEEQDQEGRGVMDMNTVLSEKILSPHLSRTNKYCFNSDHHSCCRLPPSSV